MVKIINQSIPAELDEFYRRGIINRRVRNIDTAGRKIFQDSRQNLTQLSAESLIPAAAAAWELLDISTKNLWDSAAIIWSGGDAVGYQLFVQDYITRVQRSLNLPNTPNNIFQTFGLFMRFGNGIPFMKYYFSDGEYQEATATINFKGVSDDPAVTPRVGFWLYRAWWDGDLLRRTFDFHSILGVHNEWVSRSVDLVTENENEFFGGVIFYTGSRDGDYYFDNLVVESGGEQIFHENFNAKNPSIFADRAERIPPGWEINRLYGEEFLDIVYLDP